MSVVVDRFKEGSTWAGFAALFQVLKTFLSPNVWLAVDALTAAAGAIAAALPDKDRTK